MNRDYVLPKETIAPGLHRPLNSLSHSLYQSSTRIIHTAWVTWWESASKLTFMRG